MKLSNISWTTHTFNPVMGCSKISEGCANCYAEQWSKKTQGRVQWGPGHPRIRSKPAEWKKVYGYHKESQARPWGEPRHRVFCASLADWLEEAWEVSDLADLLILINRTPDLTWQLLSKRPENWRARMEAVLAFERTLPRIDEPVAEGGTLAMIKNWLAGDPPHNVWIGATAENQKRYEERAGHIKRIPAVTRFLSVEPMLGPVKLDPFDDIDWIIAGGESGNGRRPFEWQWAQSLAEDCFIYGIPFFMKQDGALHPGTQGAIPDELWARKDFPADSTRNINP